MDAKTHQAEMVMARNRAILEALGRARIELMQAHSDSLGSFRTRTELSEEIDEVLITVEKIMLGMQK